MAEVSFFEYNDVMNIRIVAEPITRAEVKEIAAEVYGEMVKGALDIEREIIALGGEWHMDAHAVLIESGSRQEHIWGFNVYPERTDDEWIEFHSLINIRPQAGNRSMRIQNDEIQRRMRAIITKLVV